VRRKFADVIKSNGKRKSKETHAEVALNYIGELYRLERKAKKDKVTGQDLLALRQDKGKAIVTEFRKWIDAIVSKVPPDSLLGKAIHYTLAMWPRLIVYLETDFAPPDNNWVENAIRPFVLGRKNWMFAGCPEGASASAGMFSLIETAKANGWEPSAYFYFLFTHLPTAITEDELCALLPTVAKPIPLRSLLDNNQETGE
jgi:transposase